MLAFVCFQENILPYCDVGAGAAGVTNFFFLPGAKQPNQTVFFNCRIMFIF
jgi:hypothetical protein